MSPEKRKGISRAAQEVGCAEATLRRLETRKIVHPVRDSGGRRLFGDDDIAAARAHLATIPGRLKVPAEGLTDNVELPVEGQAALPGY